MLGEVARPSAIFAPLNARQRLALVAMFAVPVAAWGGVGWALVAR